MIIGDTLRIENERASRHDEQILIFGFLLETRLKWILPSYLNDDGVEHRIQLQILRRNALLSNVPFGVRQHWTPE